MVIDSNGDIITGSWKATTIEVAKGGTGVARLAENSVLIGNGTNAVESVDMSGKGTILVGQENGNPTPLSIGATNDHVLTIDSNTDTGLKWAAASGGVSGTAYATDLKIGRDAANYIDFATTANEISLHTNGSERMVILNNGNVGIGTNNPQQKLDISGGYLGVRSTSEDTDSVIYIGAPYNQETNVAYKGAIYFDAETSYSTGKLHICNRDVENDNGNGNNTSAGVDDARISILPNGNVGIGTTDPDGILHVHGGGNSTYNIFSRSDTKWFYIHSGSSNPAIGWDSGGSLRLGTSITNVGDDFSEKMRINSSGNVGIGTTTPGSQTRLGVMGGAIRIDYGQNERDFFAAYTQRTGDEGRFILRWSGSGNDFNVQLRMYNNNSNKEDQAGFFENSGNEGSFTFTGQHRSLMNKNYTSDSKGLIVSSNGKFINMDNSLNPKINQTLPYCVLSDIDNDIRVYGVISDKEDSSDQRCAGAGFVKTIPKTNTNEERIFINSLGEGAIWVSDKNGPLINGNYITSTTIPGYGGKQTLEENRLMNYTVAKITCDCDFSLTKIPKQKLKTITVTETLQRKVEEDVTESKEKTEINFDETLNRYVQTTVTEEVTTKQIVKDTYDLYDSEGNIIGTHEVEREESYDITKTEIDYDENGDVQYEDDLDENGNQQMVYKYETRFLQEDGTLLVDEADYNTRLANGESVYIACFVGCTYHCG